MTDNIVQFPKIFDNKSPRGVSEALTDFVKDKPNAQLLVVMRDPDHDLLTLGYNLMNAEDLLLLIEFAKYKWTQRTFSDVEGLYSNEDESDDE